MKLSGLKLNFRNFLATLFVGLAIASTPSVASADDNPSAVLNQIREIGVLKVPVMTGEEPGYIKDRETGEWGGFYVEFLKEIAATLGVEAELVETTWGNLAADFQSGKLDIAIGVNPNPQRGMVVDYLWEPLFIDAWAVLTPEGKEVTNWEELNNPEKQVVVQKGSTMQVVAENLLPNATVVPVEDRNLAIMELQTGRADAVVFSVFDAAQIAQQGIGKVSIPEPMLRNPATLAVARQPGNAGYINVLTNWIQQQRSLGLAQSKLRDAWTARGIDLSKLLPEGFSF